MGDAGSVFFDGLLMEATGLSGSKKVPPWQKANELMLIRKDSSSVREAFVFMEL